MSHSPRYQHGFAYVFILVFLAVLGAGLAAFGEWASHAAQREKESQLLWVGEQYRRAIALYYERTPGAGKRYPEKLEDLLQDRRFLSTQRYLRELYRDPMTGKAKWNLIRAPEGGLMGVSSRSQARPIKTGGFPEIEEEFSGAATYAEWAFVYLPPATTAAGPSNGSGAAPLPKSQPK